MVAVGRITALSIVLMAKSLCFMLYLQVQRLRHMSVMNRSCNYDSLKTVGQNVPANTFQALPQRFHRSVTSGLGLIALSKSAVLQ